MSLTDSSSDPALSAPVALATPPATDTIDPSALATAIVSAMLKQPVAVASPPPPFVQGLVTSFGQKGLTAAAALLAGYGVIAPTKEAIVISLGLSALAWTASFVWTFGREFIDHQNLVKATNALPPVVVAAK